MGMAQRFVSEIFEELVNGTRSLQFHFSDNTDTTINVHWACFEHKFAECFHDDNGTILSNASGMSYTGQVVIEAWHIANSEQLVPMSQVTQHRIPMKLIII